MQIHKIKLPQKFSANTVVNWQIDFSYQVIYAKLLYILTK